MKKFSLKTNKISQTFLQLTEYSNRNLRLNLFFWLKIFINLGPYTVIKNQSNKIYGFNLITIFFRMVFTFCTFKIRKRKRNVNNFMFCYCVCECFRCPIHEMLLNKKGN